MDESAESVTALDLPGGWTGGARWVRRLERESAVGTLAVVMGRVDAQHPFEVATAEDQQPVETLGANRADEPLGVGIRLWRNGSV